MEALVFIGRLTCLCKTSEGNHIDKTDLHWGFCTTVCHLCQIIKKSLALCAGLQGALPLYELGYGLLASLSTQNCI